MTPVLSGHAEPDLSEILDSVYGAGNYIRLDDTLDQLWQNGQFSVRALGTYAAASQTLGFCVLCDGSDDVMFDQMLSVDGVFSTPLTVGGESSVNSLFQFTWFDDARYLPYVGRVYSNPAMNPTGADHMVTYGVSGQPNTYVLAFEDWLFTANPMSDRDYQDFVVEVTYTFSQPPLAHTPEPAGLLSLLGGLAALFALRKRTSGNG